MIIGGQTSSFEQALGVEPEDWASVSKTFYCGWEDGISTAHLCWLFGAPAPKKAGTRDRKLVRFQYPQIIKHFIIARFFKLPVVTFLQNLFLLSSLLQFYAFLAGLCPFCSNAHLNNFVGLKSFSLMKAFSSFVTDIEIHSVILSKLYKLYNMFKYLSDYIICINCISGLLWCALVVANLGF